MRKPDLTPIWGVAKPQFAPLSGSHLADLVVIGLGASGLMAVREASRRGLSVIGIDAGCIGGAAAGRNGGFLMAGFDLQYDETKLVVGSARAEEWYAATEEELRRTVRDFPGIVRHTQSFRKALDAKELESVKRDFEARESDGFGVMWHDDTDGEGFIAIYDAAFDPLARCHALARTAEHFGAVLAENSPAVEVRDKFVRTPDAEIRTRAVIVAVDGNLEKLMPVLAPRVRSTRLQMIASAPLKEEFVKYPTYARWTKDYYQQLPTGEIALGGKRDHFLDTEWGADAVPTEPVQKELDELLAEITNGKGRVTNRWAGVVSITHDCLPICEKVDGIYVMGAYSTLGNVMGIVCARAVVGHLFGESRLFNLVRSDVRPAAVVPTHQISA